MVQFNKMMIMLPVMLAARKLDGENATTVYWIRVCYGLVQLVSVMVVLFTYAKAQTIASNSAYASQVVYYPPAAVPFADPNAKKKYTQAQYGAHVLTTARSLVGSTVFGIFMTLALHYYKGMVMGLAIQTVMAPFNLIENPLVKAIFLGSGIAPANKIFEEKTASELTPDDEVVDEQGNPIAPGGSGALRNRDTSDASTSSSAENATSSKKPLEEILLDTWDAGVKADISELLSVLQKKNCDFQTQADRWTPLMVLAGLGTPGTGSAITKLLAMGANPSIVDVEGWTALHWAAFHGSVEAAKVLKSETQLLTVKDKEGHTPVDMARKEGNHEVAKILEEAAGETKKSK